MIKAVTIFIVSLAGWLSFAETFHFIVHAHAKPNAVWAQMLAQAERLDDQQALRVLRFVSKAGVVLCAPSWNWCQSYGTTRISCCGKADAYEADEFRVDAKTGDIIATLTCNDQAIDCAYVPGKKVRPPGAEFVVPAERVLISTESSKSAAIVNDTNHGWIWIHPDTGVVICWASPPGG